MSYDAKRLAELQAEQQKQKPLTVQDVQAARTAYQDARDDVAKAELQLQMNRNAYAYYKPERREQLLAAQYDALAAAKEAEFNAKRAYDDIVSRGGATLEAMAHADTIKAEQEEKHRIASEQQAELLSAEARSHLKAHFIRNGGSEAEWDQQGDTIWKKYLEKLALSMND